MKVKFFAHLQDLTRCGEIEISAPQGITQDALWSALEEKFPGIIRHKNHTRLAQNFSYADAGSIFNEQDEVALIPPVSGG
jgi:molybdopterin synthase sulfur carrier subunit